MTRPKTEARPTGKYADLGASPAPTIEPHDEPRPLEPAPATSAPIPAPATSAPIPAPAPGGVAEIAAAIRATRPAPLKAPAPVYGRRAHGFVQLGVTVSPEARDLLRAAAAAHKVSMSELLDELLRRHLSQP
jgi:hypothetical protein